VPISLWTNYYTHSALMWGVVLLGSEASGVLPSKDTAEPGTC
jgi:hypothetical protein